MSDASLKRILFVDDDDDLRELAVFGLEAIGGFEVASCASGDEALALAPTFAPELLLLDVMMPSMDGPTVLARLRELPQTVATPAIFMTAAARPNEIKDLLALGAVDIVAKPFDPMALPETINSIWQRVGADR